MFTKLKTHTLGSLIAALTCAVVASPAWAGTLYGDWNYSIDSFNDSMAGNDVGGTRYEIFGTALKQTADQIFFAINTNMPLEGNSSQYAHDGLVAWGDLLFNFSGNNLDTASANGDLLAVRFAANNESGVRELGVYANVTAKELAYENGLLLRDRSLGGYNRYVASKGGNPQIGDLGATHPYFNLNHHVPNLIASGTKIGDLEFISDFSDLGLDFGHFGATGTYTFGFQFDRTLLPNGDYIYTLAPECDNDVIAGIGSLEPEPKQPVPDSSSVVALGFVCLTVAGLKNPHRKTVKA